MTDWTNFDTFALPTLGCWLLAIVSQYICKRKWLPISLTLAGCLIFATFIGLLWSGLGRPPMDFGLLTLSRRFHQDAVHTEAGPGGYFPK